MESAQVLALHPTPRCERFASGASPTLSLPAAGLMALYAAHRMCGSGMVGRRAAPSWRPRGVGGRQGTTRRSGYSPCCVLCGLCRAYLSAAVASTAAHNYPDRPNGIPMTRPALFVGSSSEGLRIAEAAQIVLDEACEVELWTQGIFGLTQGTLESLVLALPSFGFALLVLTADDMTVSRGTQRPAARDNVLFELGLFIGSLGRDRTFMLYDRTSPPALPSDLAGISAATFAPHANGNPEAALGAPCAKIRNAMERLGVRKDKESRDLEKATLSVEPTPNMLSIISAPVLITGRSSLR